MLFFAEVVDRGGFAAAGRALNVPKSRLSRRVAELEERLGVRLLHRTTRKLSLTQAGEIYHRHCVAMREQAHYTAARACFADALRSTKRNPAVRHRAWFERSRCYLEEGQRARARQDLERILAEDSDYEGLAEALAALDTPTGDDASRPEIPSR